MEKTYLCFVRFWKNSKTILHPMAEKTVNKTLMGTKNLAAPMGPDKPTK